MYREELFVWSLWNRLLWVESEAFYLILGDHARSGNRIKNSETEDVFYEQRVYASHAFDVEKMMMNSFLWSKTEADDEEEK